MNWTALIALLWQFFGPIVEKWFADIFKNAKPLGAVSTLDPPAGMARLFAAARAETWWWQAWKRSVLAVLEQAAVAHAAEFWTAMQTGGPAPQMTASEARKVAAAV